MNISLPERCQDTLWFYPPHCDHCWWAPPLALGGRPWQETVSQMCSQSLRVSFIDKIDIERNIDRKLIEINYIRYMDR